MRANQNSIEELIAWLDASLTRYRDALEIIAAGHDCPSAVARAALTTTTEKE